jgi:hypothetical protein
MKRVLAAAAMILSLAACAGPDASGDMRDASVPASGFTPIAMTSMSSGFCDDVAASDRLRAREAGFDEATISRMTRQSALQCRMLAGNIFRNKLSVASR